MLKQNPPSTSNNRTAAQQTNNIHIPNNNNKNGTNNPKIKLTQYLNSLAGSVIPTKKMPYLVLNQAFQRTQQQQYHNNNRPQQ